jgi:quercetin dioxygenase-like cupin family protein
MAEAIRYRWDDLPADRPLPQLARRRIVGQHVMVAEVFLAKGCTVDAHAHGNEQVTMVMSGKLRLRVGEDGATLVEHVLGPGDVLHLPAHVRHAAHALEDTRVLDVFSPVTEGTGIDAVGRSAGR